MLSDVSVHNNRGVLTGMDPAGDWKGSPNGGSLLFRGSSAYININPLNIGLSNSSAFSASVWIRNNNANALKGFFNFNPTNDASTYLLVMYFNTDANNSLLVTTNGGGSGKGASPASDYADEEWHNVVVTKAAGTTVTPTIYINGAANTQADGTGLTGWATEEFHLGRGINSSFFANCNIDNVRIYDGVISEEQIRTLYKNPYAGILSFHGRLQQLVPIVSLGPTPSHSFQHQYTDLGNIGFRRSWRN